MTDAIAVSIITGITTTLVALVAAIVSIKTHKAVNSRMDEFKRIAENLYHEQGKLAGIKQEKSDEKARVASLNKTVKKDEYYAY